VEDAASLATKADVAEAIVAADAAAPAAAAEAQSASQGALPDGWQIVQDGPDYFSAERYVESLGLQKVSEGAGSIEELAQKCADYDAHQAGLGEGWPNTAPAPGEGVAATA
jgi:hypothetical protein